jgi:two-component system NtrC family sensor kinase
MTTIVLVDDDAAVLRGTTRLLASHAELLTAPDGEHALAILEAERVDVVIADHRMPGMSGLELLREVRRRWPTVRRVLYSGSPPADVAEALKDGTIEAVVLKPAGVAELLVAIGGSPMGAQVLAPDARSPGLADP